MNSFIFFDQLCKHLKSIYGLDPGDVNLDFAKFENGFSQWPDEAKNDPLEYAKSFGEKYDLTPLRQS